MTEEDIASFLGKMHSYPGDLTVDAWEKNFTGTELNSFAAYPKKKEPGFTFAFLCERILDDIEQYAKKNPVTEEIRSFYANTLEDLYREQDLSGLKRKGYAYYGGNEVVACDWKKSEEAIYITVKAAVRVAAFRLITKIYILLRWD